MEVKPAPKQVTVQRKSSAAKHAGHRKHHAKRTVHARHHARRKHHAKKAARPVHRTHSALPGTPPAMVQAGMNPITSLLLPLALALAAFQVRALRS